MRPAAPLCATLVWLCAACGAKTGLRVPDATESSDATIDASDAVDVVPPMDLLFVPPPEICVDGGVTYIYVVTEQNNLYSYYPPTNAFSRIGRIECPTMTASPFSMAVDRGGTAYVVFDDGHLYRVSTRTAQCETTPYTIMQHDITTFGMGYTSNVTDNGETLYIASVNFGGGPSYLGSIDTNTFRLSIVHEFPTAVDTAELTGTGDGRLYAFSSDSITGTGSFVAEISRTTGAVETRWNLPTVTQGRGWAFASWGGAFYIFTTPVAGSTVTRFRPADGSVAVIQQIDETIVGAGVSTCAPNQ